MEAKTSPAKRPADGPAGEAAAQDDGKRPRRHSITEEELTEPEKRASDEDYLSLTTHAGGADPVALRWGAEDSCVRGPVVATTAHPGQRNAIGAHGGSYSVYRALAVAQGQLIAEHRPDLTKTVPTSTIGPHPSWAHPDRIVTMDPWGAEVLRAFEPWFKKGYDIRPTIAVTKAHVDLPEVREAIAAGRLVPDGKVLLADGQSFITKAAVEPVWYLPGVARRFNVTEDVLREALFKETNGMYAELLTRPDLKVFMPPIGGLTCYIWGDPSTLSDESVPLTCRVHDECNGSDVFGSDICTCRPYLTHAIEEGIKQAQQGGNGLVIYNRKEGRALGETLKYLVYNLRKRQEGGDTGENYFKCTSQIAGITDTRFQALMPDALHWLGVTKIHRFVSMSDVKYNAIVESGITVDERIPLPPELVPKDAAVEISAKVAIGYHGGDQYAFTEDDLKNVKGREYNAADAAAPAEGGEEAADGAAA